MLKRFLAAVAIVAVFAACDNSPLNEAEADELPSVPSLTADHTGRATVVVNPNANGNGVASSINEGLAMVDEGGRLLVKPGLYAEALFIDKGVTIEASGEGEVRLEPAAGTTHAVLVTTAAPVTLQGFTIQYPGTNGIRADGPVDLLLDGMHIVGGPPAVTGNAVLVVNDPVITPALFGGRARATIRNTLVEGNVATDVLPHAQSFGIHMTGDVDATVVGNTVRQVGGACVWIQPRIDLAGTVNADVVGNDLDQCYPSGRVSSILVGAGAPFPTPTTPTTVTGTVNLIGNTIRNSAASCLLASAISYEMVGGRIEHNRIHGVVQGCATSTGRNRTGAIWIGTLLNMPGAAPSVRFNDISGNAFAGIRLAPNVTAQLDVSCNWWGAADGPSGLGSGSGDALLVDVPATAPVYLPYASSPIAGTSATGC